MNHDNKGAAFWAPNSGFGCVEMDSPRSWAVAAACCWMNLFTLAMVRSAAVVYVGVLQTFNVSREQASWPVNLSSVSYFLTGTHVRLPLQRGTEPVGCFRRIPEIEWSKQPGCYLSLTFV